MQELKCPDCGHLNPDIRADGYTMPRTCGKCPHIWRLQDLGTIEGPKPATRLRHRGDKINALGRVSALCFTTPRAIDMRCATWVMSDAATTCHTCLAMIRARKDGNVCALSGAACGKGGLYCQACCKTPDVELIGRGT